MTKIYLSGPMSGYPDHNYPAFHEAAAILRGRNHEVINPAEFPRMPEWEWEDYLRRDLKAMLDCEGVGTLRGWTRSRGAKLEVWVAEKLSIPVIPMEAWL